MKGFDEIYHRHVDALFRFAVRQVGRRDIAEEITSEAFLALHRSQDRIDETQLPAWLYTVVRNRAIDYWRRQAAEQRALLEYERSRPKMTEQGSLLEHSLSQNKALKPVHRACLILRYVYGMERGEIAQETGLSEVQVKGHLQYGRSLLRRQFAGARR